MTVAPRRSISRRGGAFFAPLWIAAASGLLGQPAPSQPDPQPAGAPAAAASAVPAKPAYMALTERERLRLYLKRLVSPEIMLRSAASAGLGQLRDVPPEWGEGAAGFGRRFASSYGENAVRETLLFGSSGALHEDNHYIRSGLTGFGKRLKYALESSVLARRDDGTRRISASKIGSFLGASLISRAWQPPSSSGPAHAASDFGISMSVSTGFDVAREFLPDLFHPRHGLRP
jgi:hypothetical protein